MCCCCSLLLDFDTVDMLNKINKHVCCKAPSSSVCPSCLRQDNQSRSQSLFDVRVACLHVVLFFSCCRGRVRSEVLTDLPFLKRPCAPKINFFVLRSSCHLGSSRGLCLSVHNLELRLWRDSALDTTTSRCHAVQTEPIAQVEPKSKCSPS